MQNNQCFFTLSNNVKISSIGLGTWHIKDSEVIDNMIYSSYQLGYIHIDTASKYQNEYLIGNAIKKYNINHSNLFITSKLWNSDKGYYKTLEAFDETLNNLQTNYLDLYLIHWPMTSNNWIDLNIETWKAFEELYKSGKIRAIGVSNFMSQHLTSLLANCRIKPMVNQIEFHPGYRQLDTLSFCKRNNIQVEAWSPLGSSHILKNENLTKIANKYNKSVAQICIKWCLQNEVIPLPKSTNSNRLKDNISVFDFDIDNSDMLYINKMIKQESIATEIGCSQQYISKIVKQDSRYEEFKKQQKLENAEYRKQYQKDYQSEYSKTRIRKSMQ